MTTAIATEKFCARIHRESLLDALSLAVCAAKPRAIKPVLSCVLLETGDAKITVSATSLSSWVRISIPLVQVEGAGSMAVNADSLLRAVRSMRSETVQVRLGKNDMCEIVDDESRIALHTADVTEFPPIQKSQDPCIELSVKELDELFQHTAFATADELTKWTLTGVYFDKFDARNLAMVSTDSHRLAYCTSRATGKAGTQFLFPDEGVSMLKRAMDSFEPDESVGIWESENVAGAAIGGLVELGCTKLEGSFPPYKDHIPKDFDHLVTIGRNTLLSAIRQSELIVTPQKTCIKCTFDSKGMRISGETTAGSVEINLPCKVEGKPITIGINPTWITDGLGVIPERETVTIGMHAPNRPMLFSYNGNFKFIVMPVNIQE